MIRVASNEYRFVTSWRVQGTAEQVFALLDNPLDYPRWWPSVWLKAELIDRGGENGSGRVVRFLSRGKLPYTLRWTAQRLGAEPPSRISIRASGDFEGSGEWTIAQAAPGTVDVEYVWTIVANKPLLRWLSPILRPLFEWNHRWAMARGEESLRRELARRSGRQAG